MEALVARQPIFDRNKKLWGYEILYRSAPGGNQSLYKRPWWSFLYGSTQSAYGYGLQRIDSM